MSTWYELGTPPVLHAIDDPSVSEAELSAAIGPRKKVSDLTFPLIIPHRGAGRSDFPEGNLDAYLTGAAQFDCVDGGDLRLLRDGTLVDIHDATLDTATFLTGSTYNLTSLAEAKQVATRVPAGFPGSTGRALTDWDEIAGRLGGKVVLTPEIKADSNPWAAGVQGQALADSIVAKGLTESVVVGSFYLTELQPCLDAGIECMFFPLGDASGTTAKNSAIAAKAAGCNWVALSAGAGTGTTADVPAYVAMGFDHVGVGTLNRRTEWAAWQAAGCDWCFSDSPVYMRARSADRLSRTNWQSGVFPSGVLASTNWQGDRGTIANGKWTPPRPTQPRMHLLGRLQPANPNAFTLSTPVYFDTIGSATDRHADLGFSTTDDFFSPTAPSAVIDGYIVAVRVAAANQLQVYKVVNGAVTSLGSTTGVLAVAGAAVPITVQFTSTQVIVTRTDTGTTLTATRDNVGVSDPVAYLHAGLNDNTGSQTGLVVSYGDLVLS